MKRIRLNYANVMATIAVFIALGGTSYAALTPPRNSVGSAQLKANAVTSAKIRNASIRAADLERGARSGFRGPRGSAGPDGARGPAGVAKAIVRTRETVPARPGLAAGSYVDVVNVALPAGPWIVTATTEVVSNAAVSDLFRCFVVVDGVRRGLGKVHTTGNAAGAASSGELTLIEIVDNAGPSSVVLSCGHDSVLPDGSDVRFDRAKVLAVPVEKVDVAANAG